MVFSPAGSENHWFRLFIGRAKSFFCPSKANTRYVHLELDTTYARMHFLGLLGITIKNSRFDVNF